MTKQEIKEKILKFKTDEEIINFIKQRILELEKETKEKTIGQGYTTISNDYISSKIHYKPVASLNGKDSPNLLYDDMTPYVELIKELSNYKSYLNELYLFRPLMFEIFNYMSCKESKDNIGDTLIERSLLYFKTMSNGIENISIREFHKNKYAFCSENSGLAQNIFKILGIDSQLIIGTRNDEPHAYNLIFPKGYGNLPAVLFDSSYTIDFVNDESKHFSFGYFKVLNDQEYNNLMSGNVTPIDISSSAQTLLKYYPQLSGLCPMYENAKYSIGSSELTKKFKVISEYSQI